MFLCSPASWDDAGVFHAEPMKTLVFSCFNGEIRSKVIIYIHTDSMGRDIMVVTLNVYYRGASGSACRFVEDMVSEEVLADVRAEDGCLGYSYYLSMEDRDLVLLVEHWRDHRALDLHSVSPNMARIGTLKERHGLISEIERFED